MRVISSLILPAEYKALRFCRKHLAAQE